MADYVPSKIVKQLADALQARAIAHAMHEDGVLVIVFEDGRKLRFTKADIARTLSEPPSANMESIRGNVEETAPLPSHKRRKPHAET